MDCVAYSGCHTASAALVFMEWILALKAANIKPQDTVLLHVMYFLSKLSADMEC